MRRKEFRPFWSHECLRQGFQLILRCKKMIHRAEQQRNLLCIALKRGQVQSIALCNGDGFSRNGIFLKEFDIVFQQFDRIDPIASLCQGVTIPACCCAGFQDAHIGPKVGFYILHRGKVFHHAVFRKKCRNGAEADCLSHHKLRIDAKAQEARTK